MRSPPFQVRGHFFAAAAAAAMRRILVDNARRKGSQKRGGDRGRADFDVSELVQLRYFAGLTLAEAAQVLGISA